MFAPASIHHTHVFLGPLFSEVQVHRIIQKQLAFFLFLYMRFDADMMQSIIENEPMGRYLNPYISAFIVALEGVFSGLLVTFLLINYVETDEVNQS